MRFSINIKKTAQQSLLIFSSLIVLHQVKAEEQKQLSLPDFIKRATESDTRFEAILIDRLPLAYQKQLQLPDSDVIMDIKYQHNFYLDQDRDNPQGNISLTKLFPYNGTEISFSYGKNSSPFSTTDDASIELLISQPIANNAFGKAVRLQDKIIEIQNDIVRYQIIEAYEDYLASLTAVYYNWYSAWENLKVGKLSYQSNLKLMDNILERQRQKIALPVDVNKMKLLLIDKQENTIVLQEIYDAYANTIYKAITKTASADKTSTTVTAYKPAKPPAPKADISFSLQYDRFITDSRSYNIFNMLERQGELEINKIADELLPSTKLLLGYRQEGEDWDISQQKDNLFAGITVSWPIGHTKSTVKKEIAQIAQRKNVLNTENKYTELKLNLENLALQIKREKKLIKITEQKIKLSEAVLKDEAENYSYGKITLNDYISAVNRVDVNRYSLTDHTVQLNKLIIEWLRLTDQLVSKKILETS